MAEIRAALAAGLTVITHTDAVSVPGWSGAGYILLDPLTGDGAYKISGGQNGGLVFLLGTIAGLFMGLAITAVIAGGVAPALLVGLLVAAIVITIIALALAKLSGEKNDRECLTAGVLVGFDLGTIWGLEWASAAKVQFPPLLISSLLTSEFFATGAISAPLWQDCLYP